MRVTDAYRKIDGHWLVTMEHVSVPVNLDTGEPDLKEYLAAGASQKLAVEHLARPSPMAAENLHHFIVVQVDGDRLSVEVVSSGPTALL